jgi:SpoVK/Ycf46/Vps4 family AAA+-type ATPase
VDLAEVSAAIRARAGVALPAGVDLVSPGAGWRTLVLGVEPAAQLRDAVARLEHQSRVLDDWRMSTAARADRGVRLLFTGPPGTGKSLAAEVVATEAGTDLLVVDVSRVVSKWIGETEKNLAAVFDIAERTQAVLLLDEADALFATRTQIADARDRYANLETAYLLQRLDRFDGMAVLATNLRQNIDVAFVRRMDYVVEFDLPDQAARTDLWEQHLPAALRGRDVDLRELARLYAVPGAWIRNVALGAAFLAADAGDLVGERHLVTAMRREYAKASRPFPGEPVRLDDVERDLRAARRPTAAAAPGGSEEGT